PEICLQAARGKAHEVLHVARPGELLAAAQAGVTGQRRRVDDRVHLGQGAEALYRLVREIVRGDARAAAVVPGEAAGAEDDRRGCGEFMLDRLLDALRAIAERVRDSRQIGLT